MNSASLVVLLLFFAARAVQCSWQEVKIGLLIDYEEPLSQAINNETVESLVNYMRDTLRTSNLSVETHIVTDYEQFATEVEEDPRVCTEMVALISATSCPRTKSIYDLVAEHCPSTLILALHERSCPRPARQAGLGFPVTGSPSDAIPMLVDMRHDLLRDWTRINLVHDNTVSKDTLHDIVDGLASASGPSIMPASVVTYKVDGSRRRVTPLVDGSVTMDSASKQDHTACMRPGTKERFSAKHLMRHIDMDSSLNYFVLMGSPQTIETIVEEAHNHSLLNLPRRWLLIFTEVIPRPKKFWANLSPILALSDTAVVQREVDEYGDCGEMSEGCQLRLAFEVLHEAMRRLAETSDASDRAVVTFDFRDKELKKMESLRRRTKSKLLAEISSQLTNELSGSSYCGACDRYVVQVFEKKAPKEDKKPWIKKKPKQKSVWIENQDFDVLVQKATTWTPYKGLSMDKLALLQADADGQMIQKNVKVGIFQQLPRIRVVKDPNGKCNATGLTPELLIMLAFRLNFTIEWVCNYDKEGFGRFDAATNKWSGLMGAVLSGEVTIGGNMFWKLPSRMSQAKELRWSIPFTEESVGMMVQKSTENHRWLFLLPFTWDSWWAVVISTLLIGPLVYYINTSCKFYDYHGLRNEKGLFRFENCIWYTYGAVVGQGGEHLPQALASRTIVSFWWLFVIVTATTYSGNLVAVLTFPKVVQPIQDVKDLMGDWWISWATQENSDIHEVLLTDRWSDLAKLRPDMKYMDWNKDKEEIIKKAGKQRLAWIARDEEIKYIVSTKYLATNDCTLHLAKETLFRTPVHFVYAPGTPAAMIKIINEEITTLGMTGLIAHWTAHYTQLGNDCLKPLIVYAGDVRKIELLHMYGSYFVLTVGLALSVVVLLGEFVFVNCYRPKTRAGQNPLQSFYGKMASGAAAGYMGRNGSPTSREGLIGLNKAANLNFIQPTIRGEGDLKGKWAQGPPGRAPGLRPIGASPPSGVGPEPGLSPPNYGAAFEQQQQNGSNSNYNTSSNYNYFNYDAGKTNFRSRFGLQ